jgi:hypothetical protein
MNTNKPELFSFSWFKDFNLSLEELKNLAMQEEWDYQLKPSGKLPILYNYVHHTFAKLQEEKKIEGKGEFCIFNTGLVTENQEEIFGYFQKNKKPDAISPWFFQGWRKESERDLSKFERLPETANYFSEPSDLIYDSNLDLRINIDHITQDNRQRFPHQLDNMDNYQLGNILQGTINDAKKRIKRNYKTAIPQFFKGKIQLLLPLCLVLKAKADLALAVGKEEGVYLASTCLTLDMAINNARLIAKPDDEWLKP